MPQPFNPAVRAEQIRLLYGHNIPIQILAMITGTVYVATFWELVDQVKLSMWLIIFLLLCLSRTTAAVIFNRLSIQDYLVMERWGSVYVLGAFLAGLMWGIMCLFFSPDWPVSHQVILFAVFTGLIAASFNANASVFAAFSAFYLPAMGCLFYMLIREPLQGYLTLITLYIFYAVVMYLSALMFHNRLARSLEARFENERLLCQLAESNTKLLQLAEIDQLTGIANRRAMDKCLKHEWNRLCRAGKPLSFLFIDIDYFKQYNDTYGHDGGDKCLVSVSRLLVGYCRRANDMVTRFGGEEFAIILPETPEEDALKIAADILTELERLNIPHLGSHIAQQLTLSIGVASMIPHQLDSEIALLLAADEALYEAKRLGRKQIVKANLAYQHVMETFT
ncbi:MAG TPA: diguanylate cyclase [Methylophilus sp.]